MRVWRGIFTHHTRDDVRNRAFDCLPADSSGHFVLILDKILDNFSNEGDGRKLTSLSKSVEVALSHAGTHGWLIELEISPEHLLDSEPYLERERNEFPPDSEAWERISEALEMTHRDREVFLMHAATFTIHKISMVGSYSEED